jgi:hypothetical protein
MKEKSDLDHLNYLKFVEWEKANRLYDDNDTNSSLCHEDRTHFRNDCFIEETGKEIYEDL